MDSPCKGKSTIPLVQVYAIRNDPTPVKRVGIIKYFQVTISWDIRRFLVFVPFHSACYCKCNFISFNPGLELKATIHGSSQFHHWLVMVGHGWLLLVMVETNNFIWTLNHSRNIGGCIPVVWLGGILLIGSPSIIFVHCWRRVPLLFPMLSNYCFVSIIDHWCCGSSLEPHHMGFFGNRRSLNLIGS